jgi:protein involved in polysaccharide export with SLBB domain
MAKMKTSYFGVLCFCALLFELSLLSGCQTKQADAQFSALPGTTSNGTAGLGAARDHIRVNDTLKITYTMQTGVLSLPPMSERVGDDGKVRLLHNKIFVAAGKTTRQLEEEIIAAYVPDYYREMNVSVDWQDNTQFFYVDGEVKSPNRHVYLAL